jgi:hypothetical protein
MPFSPKPEESNKQIIKAGDILAFSHMRGNSNPREYAWAFDLVNRWRACHAYPINTFQSLLRRKIRTGGYTGDPFVAQRLKRLPTIIDKLRRYRSMNLITMQDIGGLRAVLENTNDVYRLKNEYQNCRFSHEQIQCRDYIQCPRDEDGYRSIHLIYKYKNTSNPNYDDLRLELQIRTRLQHLWATAVETMGTILGQALKTRRGEKDWLDFFTLISDAFSIKEGTTRIPRFQHLEKESLIEEIRRLDNTINASSKMSQLSVAIQYLDKRKANSYHLLVLNSIEQFTMIKSYDRDQYEYAVSDYQLYEKKAVEGEPIEPVLVSAGKLDSVRKAYPSFFLDISEFLFILQKILALKYI